MSYYLLQKTKSGVLSPVISQRPMRNMTSTSVFLMCKDIQRELVNMCIYDGIVSYLDIIQFVNPCEYIFSPCPHTDKPICTLQTKSGLYFELIEVFDLVDIKITQGTCLIHSDFSDDVLKCINKQCHAMNIMVDGNQTVLQLRKKFLIEFQDSNSVSHVDPLIHNQDLTNGMDSAVFTADAKYGFLFHEVKHNTNLENYVTEMVNALMIILNHQSDNGIAILKVNYLFHRPILDVIYILSSMYEKVYIVKPNTSNAMSHDKYIVCKNKLPNTDLYKVNYDILRINANKRIYSLIDHNLPLSFINRINDINVIIGERQLEYFDQALTIMSSSNKYEAINAIVSKNIQKSASMCEKLGLPFVKTNIFLDKR